MSDKDLQRVTEYVSDIGQAASRRSLPPRRNHITQKVRIANLRTLYIAIYNDARSAEIFLRLKGSDCFPELIGLYDVVARLMSLALQYGAPLETIGDLLAGAQFAPCGPVSGHDRLKHFTSLPDLVVEYCGRHERGHVPLSTNAEEAS